MYSVQIAKVLVMPETSEGSILDWISPKPVARTGALLTEGTFRDRLDKSLLMKAACPQRGRCYRLPFERLASSVAVGLQQSFIGSSLPRNTAEIVGISLTSTVA